MAVDPKKLGALVDKHAQKKAPPKKPFGGGGPPKGGKSSEQHDDGGDHQESDGDEHGGGKGDQAAKDKKIAEGQARRIANGNGEDALHDLAEDLEADLGGDEEEGEDDAPPAWATDHEIWSRAEAAVKTVEDLDEMDHAAVLVHTYKALGGEIAGHDEEGDGGDHQEPDGDEGYDE